jgi:hypothetical protein
MLSMLVAYDSDGEVVATLDYMVARDEGGEPIGLIDFEAHERAGGKLRDLWEVAGAAGSGTWPEWLGQQAHAFRVKLEPGGKRIAALVHRQAGRRRERAPLEAAIAERIAAAAGEAADLRDLVGGPDRPLRLDARGETAGRPPTAGTPKHLPIARRHDLEG